MTEPDMGRLFDAIAIFNAGDAETAFKRALALVNSPIADDAIETAGMFLALTRRVDDLLRFDDYARTWGHARSVTFARVMMRCLTERQYQIPAHFAQHMAVDHALYPLALYFSGCARLGAGDTDAALAIFKLFRGLAGRADQQAFLLVPGVNRYYRQGCLVATAAEVPERAAMAADALPFLVDFDLRAAAGAAGPVFLAAADAVYVERFAREFLETLPAGRACHLHVVNPRAETLDLLADLAGLRPEGLGISTSRDPHYAHAVAFACARFFVVPPLMAAYHRRLVVLDIDIAARPAIDRLCLLPDDFDIAAFRNSQIEPASAYACGVLVVEPTRRAAGFVDLLARFCLPSLGLPLQFGWFLDQAALLSVRHYGVGAWPDFRWLDLDAALGGVITDLIPSSASGDEKIALTFKASLARDETAFGASWAMTFGASPPV